MIIVNTYKQQLHIVHKSSNNVWHLITKTITTLQHSATLHHTTPHFTTLCFTSDTDVCAPDDGWWYHPKHVEQFPYMNKLCNVASCWIYIGILEQTTCVKTSWILTNTNSTWMVTDADEPRENSLSSSVMDLWFLKLIPLAILSSRCSYGDEVFFFPVPLANSDETSDYPRVLRFAVCKALRLGSQK